MGESVLMDWKGGVAHHCLSRTDRKSAVSAGRGDGILLAADPIRNGLSVRSVVFSGEGRSVGGRFDVVSLGKMAA